RNGLALPAWEIPGRTTWSGSPVGTGDPLPAEISTTLGSRTLAEAIQGIDHTIAIYDDPSGERRRQVVVWDPSGDSLGAFDLSGWPYDQELRWAQVQEGVLYMCTAHMTYASSTGGLNAFITAISLPTGDALWQSDPLVCNSWSFLLRDGWIISGYGFTAEPDFLYVLYMKTGEVVERKKLKSGPEVILEKGGTLFVRTYDRDYEFVVR